MTVAELASELEGHDPSMPVQIEVWIKGPDGTEVDVRGPLNCIKWTRGTDHVLVAHWGERHDLPHETK